MLPLTFLLACSTPAPEATEHAPTPAVQPVADAPAPIAPAPSFDPIATARARAAVATLGATLKGTLKAKMTEGGPTAALEVCTQDAQSLTAGVAASTGVQVGRSSLRLRNPSNAGPDWVTPWLEAHSTLQGAEGSTTTATVDGRQVVRVVMPIPVEAPCLICHGPTEGRAADVGAAITRAYPDDKANGYAAGDLRGAIWAQAPVTDTKLVLPLDGDKLWALDSSTRNAMAKIDDALSKAPADMAAVHTMAASIQSAVDEMISGCTMEGPDHDALHGFLGALFPAVKALSTATDLKTGAAAREHLLALAAQFDLSFE